MFPRTGGLALSAACGSVGASPNREAILNPVTHRDYRMAGSVFVRQFPRRLDIVSPGGFPPGITPEDLLWRQSPRNRRIAETCARCGLVERSGQGANRMFEESITCSSWTRSSGTSRWLLKSRNGSPTSRTRALSRGSDAAGGSGSFSHGSSTASWGSLEPTPASGAWTGTPDQVQGLLRELKRERRVHLRGATKAGRWFPGGRQWPDCVDGDAITQFHARETQFRPASTPASKDLQTSLLTRSSRYGWNGPVCSVVARKSQIALPCRRLGKQDAGFALGFFGFQPLRVEAAEDGEVDVGFGLALGALVELGEAEVG